MHVNILAPLLVLLHQHQQQHCLCCSPLHTLFGVIFWVSALPVRTTCLSEESFCMVCISRVCEAFIHMTQGQTAAVRLWQSLLAIENTRRWTGDHNLVWGAAAVLLAAVMHQACCTVAQVFNTHSCPVLYSAARLTSDVQDNRLTWLLEYLFNSFRHQLAQLVTVPIMADCMSVWQTACHLDRL